MKKEINIFWYNTLIISITIVLIEIIFKLTSSSNIFDTSTIRIIFSSTCIALILSFILTFIKIKYHKIINIVFLCIITFYAFLQLGLYNFIGVYISFNITSQAGAIAGYIIDFFKSFYWYYYLILLPVILLFVFYYLIDNKKIKIKVNNNNNSIYKNLLRFVAFLLIFTFLFDLTVNLNILQNQLQSVSNKELIKNPSNPSITIKQFGVTMYGVLDIKNLIFNNNDNDVDINNQNLIYENESNRNIDDTKWIETISNEDDLVKNYLNYYFINNKITNTNEYTGLFEDKNLIVIMMESVNDIIINKDFFPNFNKLLNEGYYFENNFSPRNSCSTGNNELSGMIGLYSIYNKCTANVYKDNYYPQSIFNLFNNKGYKTSSMHNYDDTYYDRNDIHKNLFSQKYYDVNELNLSYNNEVDEWSSDEEFLETVVDILENYDDDTKFMTWLTTVTTHYPYNNSFYGNRYLDLFDNYDYDIKLKRYMSKLKVLDEGLGKLIDGLEKQGKLDDTVIVLFGDHYPYGLSNKSIESILNYDISEEYEIERVPFVIWSNNIESKVFKQYTSYVNIVPTIANLFNLDYDPRYYVGEDLFSNDYESIVVFSDGSWKNEYAFYDALNSTINYYTGYNYSINEIIEINERVNNKIKYSNLAIQHDYFNYLDSKIKK